jgi:hypothetical protein
VIALRKKNQAKKFSDHRTISLISHTPKIAARIPSKSLEIKIEQLIEEATAGKEISLNIGTRNVRTLRQAGRLENLTSDMDRFEINVVGLSEVPWPGKGKIVSGNYIMFSSS